MVGAVADTEQETECPAIQNPNITDIYASGVIGFPLVVVIGNIRGFGDIHRIPTPFGSQESAINCMSYWHLRHSMNVVPRDVNNEN
jgi:hypothetical protein